MTKSTSRRKFLHGGFALTAAVSGSVLQGEPTTKSDPDILMIGPKPGYSPQIGTLVSMMIAMRGQVLASTRGMTEADLDFLLDSKANTIGSLLMHLAATDAYYHLKTFGGMPWDSWNDSIKKRWAVAMNLGGAARQAIKGHNLDYYLGNLEETREKTLAEFRKRDDQWLLSVDKANPEWGRLNNYFEWFHVCEHESNHNGQIKFIKARLPGVKAEPTGQ